MGQHLVGVLRRELTGLLELGLELGGGVGQELSDLVVASLRLAVPNTVTRIDRPREPPT